MRNQFNYYGSKTSRISYYSENYDPKRAREAEAKAYMKSSNALLLLHAKTKFKIGDKVIIDGKVEATITKVQPIGYITVPGSYACYSMKWLEPVTCDVNIYQYSRKDSRGRQVWVGQTVENNIKLLKESV